MNPQPSRSAEDLGLPTGDAVLHNGKVYRLPEGHQLDTPRQTDIGPTPMPQPIPTATTQQIVKTSHVDRAEAFHIATSRLSWVFVVAGVLIAVWRFDAHIASLMTLGFAFGAYVLAWVIGWLVYQFNSPDGATILQVLLSYRLLRHEQKERLRYYRRHKE